MRVFMLLWPWPLPDDLDTRTWPRYSVDVPCISKIKFLGQSFQKIQREQDTFDTNKQTRSNASSATFVILISSILHHHPALLHRHTLIMDRLLTVLVAFSILVLKLSFSQSLSLYSYLSLPRADLLELWPLFGSHWWWCSIDKCDRTSSITRGHDYKLFLDYSRLNIRKHFFQWKSCTCME